MKKNFKKNGFTLMEVILYVAIISIFLGGAVSIGWGIVLGSIKANVQKEVADNLALFEKKFRYEVMNAAAVSVTDTSVLITPIDTAREQVLFDISDQKVMYGEGDSGECSMVEMCALTSSNVRVVELSFEDLSNPAAESKVIRFFIDIQYNTSSTRPEWNYQNSLSSSVETRSL